MTFPVTRAMAIVTASAVSLVALRSASFLSTANARSTQAWARLSWSARPERIEQCRRLSDAELAERPAHMRLRLECEGRFARYALHLSVDGAIALDDTVQGDGLRHDRPMHVLRDVALRPGTRRLRLTLARLDSAGTASDASAGAAANPDAGARSSPDARSDTVLGEREGREREERERRAGESIPAHLSLDTTITLGAGRVVLLTYDGARRTLVARAGSTSP